MGGFTKQDARASGLNLDQYSVDDMLADLGNHRHTELPLSGRRLTKDTPPPDSAGPGKRLVKLMEEDTDLQSAWSTLYNPSMDEDRSDGLGTGQTHRTGINFRPNQNATAGRGTSVIRRRARSHSPRRANRGRGGSILGIAMGTRPAKLPGSHKPPLGPKDSPSIRHIRPRVTIKATDDSAVGPAKRPNPTSGQGNEQVAHWYVGRLTVNNDHSDFFSPSKRADIAEPMRGAPIHQNAGKKVVPTAPAAMRTSPLRKTPASPRPKPTQLALSGLRMVQSSLNQVQGDLAVSKHAPKSTDNRDVNASVKDVPPPAGEWVVPPPPARFDDLPSPFEHASLPPPPQELLEELQKVNSELAVRLPSSFKEVEGGLGLAGPSSDSKIEEVPPAVLDTEVLPVGVTTAHEQEVSLSVAETANRLKTEIKDLDEELASATVLMEIYKVKLDEATKQEDDILVKLERTRHGKQDITFRHDSQSDKMESIKNQLAVLREEYRNLCAAEPDQVKEDLIENQAWVEVEWQGREQDHQQESLKRQVLETEILKKQQEYLHREQARISDVLKLQEEEDIQARISDVPKLQEEEDIQARISDVPKLQEEEDIQARISDVPKLQEEDIQARISDVPKLQEEEDIQARISDVPKLQEEDIQARISDVPKLQEEEDIHREREYPEDPEANEQHLEAPRQADIEEERVDKERPGLEQHLNGSGLEFSIHAPRAGAIKIEAPDTLSDKKDPASDSAAFKARNPIFPGDAIPQGTDLFPFKVKVVLRPIFDKDPVELSFTHTDQAAQKVRRALSDALSAADFKYLSDLPDYVAYVDDINKRFFARMGKIYGGGW